MKPIKLTPAAKQHELPKPHHDEGCMKCGGFAGEPCEPRRHLVHDLERGSVIPGRPNLVAFAAYIRILETQNKKMRQHLENTECSDCAYVEKTGALLDSIRPLPTP